MRMKFLLLLLLCNTYLCIAQNSNTKTYWAKTDSIKAKMTTSDKDDLFFCFYNEDMKKIAIDSISGKCNLIFHYGIVIDLKIDKVDKYTFKATLKDFKGYINFARCELDIIQYQKKTKFIFTNK